MACLLTVMGGRINQVGITKEKAMDERQVKTEQLLQEISTHLRHIKWLMAAGLAVSITLLLTVIGLTFFPVLVGLILAAFLIVGPTAYLYYVFVATVQHRESRLRSAESESNTLLSKATR